MSKSPSDGTSSTEGKEMKGLVAAAAMIAAGDQSNNGSNGNGSSAKKSPLIIGSAPKITASSASAKSTTTATRGAKKPKDMTAARARRLEQNRRAAIESRRRKKVMIAELQRSVTFYTKANENLKMDNVDLEQKLFVARQRVLQMEMHKGSGVSNGGGVAARATPSSIIGAVSVPSAVVGALKSPPEETKSAVASAAVTAKQPINNNNELGTKPPARRSQINDEQQQQPQPQIPLATTIPFPPLHPSVSPPQSDQQQQQQYAQRAQLTATQALYETMGYPSSTAARVAANTCSQFVGNPSTADVASNSSTHDVSQANNVLEIDTSATAPAVSSSTIETIAAVAPQLPNEEEVGSDKYIEALQKVSSYYSSCIPLLSVVSSFMSNL